MSGARRHLPMADQPRPERADAAANRRKILVAAELVLGAKPAGDVTMDDIARAAGVGRATLYRRYPTVGAVAEALLDEHESVLQRLILEGPPPLGPGAAPAARLAAFYDAMLELLAQHSSLVLATEVGQARFATGAYRFWRLHVRHLVEEAGVAEPDVMADILLAPLAPEVYRHQREQGASDARISAGLSRLAAAVL